MFLIKKSVKVQVENYLNTVMWQPNRLTTYTGWYLWIRIARYPRQNPCWNVSIYKDPNDSLKHVIYAVCIILSCFVKQGPAQFPCLITVAIFLVSIRTSRKDFDRHIPSTLEEPFRTEKTIFPFFSHSMKTIFPFPFTLNMIVVTVFLPILNPMKLHLVHNRKENCHHDHIQCERKWKYSFHSVDFCTDGVVCHLTSWG